MTSAYIELIKKNCQEVESLSDLLNCIRSIRLPRPYAKLSLFVGMFVYSVPGFIVVINREGWFGGKEELLIYSILILFGILLILMGRTTKNEATITEYSHSDTNDDLRVEYQEINTAIRYRDKQITRLAYLSLAVIGILAAVFYEADRPFEPAVTVLGFFITFYSNHHK